MSKNKISLQFITPSKAGHNWCVDITQDYNKKLLPEFISVMQALRQDPDYMEGYIEKVETGSVHFKFWGVFNHKINGRSVQGNTPLLSIEQLLDRIKSPEVPALSPFIHLLIEQYAEHGIKFTPVFELIKK